VRCNIPCAPQHGVIFSTPITPKHLEKRVPLATSSAYRRIKTGMAIPMRTVLTIITWWFSINLALGVIWTCYCMWPRQRLTLQPIRRVPTKLP